MQFTPKSITRSKSVWPQRNSFRLAIIVCCFVSTVCTGMVSISSGQRVVVVNGREVIVPEFNGDGLNPKRPVQRNQGKQTEQEKSPLPVFKALGNQPLISWHNGNVLPGKLTRATDSKLFWNSDLFNGDLEVDFSAIDNIRYPRDKSKRLSEERYLLRTLSGDKLYGNITRIEAGRLFMTSARHGELEIKMEKVSRIVDLENSGYVFLGISELDDWESVGKTKAEWKLSDTGELECAKRGCDIQFRTELPEVFQIELIVHWKKELDFVFGLGAVDSPKTLKLLPRIETWDDALVLNNKNDDFEIVYGTIDAESKQLALQIHWNRKTNLITVRNERGEELCQTKGPEDRGNATDGIYIGNRKGDLQIETLRISKTSGGFDPSKQGVQIGDGTTAYGDLVAFDGENWTVEPSADDAEGGEEKPAANDGENQTVSVEQFRSAVLSLDSEPQSTSNNVQLRFQDGSLIQGSLKDVANEKLNLLTSFSDQPVGSKFDGLSIMRLLTDAKGIAKTNEQGKHRLLTDYGVLLGQVLSGSGKPNDVIRWRPVGCETGLPLANSDTRIILQDNEDREVESEAARWPDTIYFNNKDTISCRVLSIDKNEIEFESFTEKSRVLQKSVKAIDFSQSQDTRTVAFDEPGWIFPTPEEKEEEEEDEKEPENEKAKAPVGRAPVDRAPGGRAPIERMPVGRRPIGGPAGVIAEPAITVVGPNELTVEGPIGFGHSSLSTIGSLKFDIEWPGSSYNTLDIRQFLRAPKNSLGGVGVKLIMRKDLLMIGNLGQERTVHYERSVARGSKAEIEIFFDGQNLNVMVDGQQVFSRVVDSKLIKGSAVYFDLTSFPSRTTPRITIKNLAVDNRGSTANPVFIEPEKLDLLMTIPRMRKDNPPQHILCARNRDFLRGELIGMDGSEVKFQSLFDDFTFQRDLVSSIVWLHPELSTDLNDVNEDEQPVEKTDPENAPEAGTDSQNDSQTVQILLRGGARVTIDAKEWSETDFSGSSSTLGNCSVPIEEILELRFGKFAVDATDVAYAHWIAKPAPEPKINDPSDDTGYGKSSPLVGTTPSDFSMKLLDGSEFRLSDHRGKVVVLDFWATWCGPCIRALPSMIEATDSFDPDQVVFIAVNQRETVELIKDYIAKKEWKMTVALDNGDVGREFNCNNIPHTVIIDRKGKIAFLETGTSSDLKNKMVNAIQEIAGPESRKKQN